MTCDSLKSIPEIYSLPKKGNRDFQMLHKLRGHYTENKSKIQGTVSGMRVLVPFTMLAFVKIHALQMFAKKATLPAVYGALIKVYRRIQKTVRTCFEVMPIAVQWLGVRVPKIRREQVMRISQRQGTELRLL